MPTPPVPDPTDDPTDELTGELTDEVAAGLPAAPAGGRTTITPYRDGPLLVRGEFRLVDTDGNEIDPGRRTVALCRCGKSGIKPFCDGTHKLTGFTAESAPARPRPAARIDRDS
ncbi:CDGSH iron-sulfur domain-containing protein [Modestobacter lapidis]